MKRISSFLIYFFWYLWREIEPKGVIPEPYRIKGRIGLKLAYELARDLSAVS
jgi:hypothetical protein